MIGPPAEARPRQCWCAMQLQAELDFNSKQMLIAERRLTTMNPAKQQQQRHAFRDVCERVMIENVALEL